MKIRSDFVSNSSSSSFILGANGSLIDFVKSCGGYDDFVVDSIVSEINANGIITKEEAIAKYREFIEYDYWIEREIIQSHFGTTTVAWKDEQEFMYRSGKDEYKKLKNGLIERKVAALSINQRLRRICRCQL